MRKAFSRIGFGTARTLQGSETHEAALAAALRAGVSLIDTSANYGAGGSERSGIDARPPPWRCCSTLTLLNLLVVRS